MLHACIHDGSMCDAASPQRRRLGMFGSLGCAGCILPLHVLMLTTRLPAAQPARSRGDIVPISFPLYT